MRQKQRVYSLIFFVITLIASCDSENVIYDLSHQSSELVNQNGDKVVFPNDFNGDISVITFIYTHCPDVCPVITANMKNIQHELQDTSGIHFIEISFDPERDTASVLKKYKELYGLNNQFSFLTGKPATIDTLLNRMEIFAEKVRADSLSQTGGGYNMNHSNSLYIMDQAGRIRFEYPASVVPPGNVIEDLNKLR